MAVKYSDSIFQKMKTIDVTGAETVVVLEPDVSIYKLVFGSTDTVVSFDASGLSIADNEALSLELILSFGSTVCEVEFGEEIAWYDLIPPVLSAPNKDYTLLMRTEDKARSWNGGAQVSQNNGREAE